MSYYSILCPVHMHIITQGTLWYSHSPDITVSCPPHNSSNSKDGAMDVVELVQAVLATSGGEQVQVVAIPENITR